MATLAETAYRLRIVRRAQSQFLRLWAMERLRQPRRSTPEVPAEVQKRLVDPFDRDWTLMYRGDVLDE